MPKELPPRPNLEQYKKQAKDLVKDLANSSTEALSRIRRYHPGLRELPASAIAIKLSDAQLVIAREHSFATWSEFARQVRKLQRAADDVSTTPPATVFSERIRVDGIELAIDVAVPKDALALALFACVSGTSRFNPRNRYLAGVLNQGNLGTVLADLLTEEEELADMRSEALQFDIDLLSRRIITITDWIVEQPLLRNLAVGYCGAGTAAAAALAAAAQRPNVVRAVVSSGGRPDLAGPFLGRVHAPTLFTVGVNDAVAVGFNYSSMTPFPRETVLGFERIDGAGQQFEEEGALEKSATLARDWFRRYLS
jgi:putative phosphoribosyl transferase